MRRTRVAAVAVALLASLPTPSLAEGVPDACGDGIDPSADLTRAHLVYSATSFQVRTEACASAYLAGNIEVRINLTTLGAGVRISGLVEDWGRYSTWSGLTFHTGPGDTAGTPIAGHDYFHNPDTPATSGRTAFGYGAWADLLPGVPIPDMIEWYAETRYPAALADRLPDSGTAAAGRLTVTRPSEIVASQEGRPVHGMGWAYVDGAIGYDDVAGSGVAYRRATLRRLDGSRLPLQYDASGEGTTGCTACGRWTVRFQTPVNVTLRAGFDGDGYTDPSPRPTVKVLVHAFVSLDLPARMTVRRGDPVTFRGVVRPKAPGTRVTIQVRTGATGSPWRNYASVPLVTGPYDTYYRFTWRPSVAGTATFRTVWTYGTSADGGVVDGASTRYATVTAT